MDTVVLPTPPTSGAILSSNNDNYGYGLAELITNNNVAETGREILASIGTSTANIIANNGVNSVAALNATNLASVSNLKATGDASVAGLNATNLAGVSVTKQVTDGTVSITKNVNDGTVSVTKAVTDAQVASATNSAEARLATAISSAEIRELINSTATANLMANRDTQMAVFKDGSHTREETQEAICELSKDTAKGFADAALQACKDAAELARQIAECCCEQKILTLQQGNETRALILSENQKKLEADNADLRMQLLLSKNSKGDK